MGMQFRPVVEKWGESITWSNRLEDHGDICGLIELPCVVGAVESESGQEPYGQFTAVWIFDGVAYLDWLEKRDWGKLTEDRFPLSDGERDLLDHMAECVPVWRHDSLDAGGVLRFYVD